MPLETPHSETVVLSRVASGDEYAFAQLFNAYHQELTGFIFLLTRSMPLTEEIVQDTFTKIWVQREQLSSVIRFRPYLFTLSRNHTFNHLRGLAREARKRQQWTAHYISESQAESAEEQAHRQQQYCLLIEEAVRRLPPQQQKAYLLSRREGLSHEDIGREMQLSRETIKKHITLALRTIRDYVRANAGRILTGIALILTNS